MTDIPTRVTADGMVQLGINIFCRAGATHQEAEAISTNLVNSNLSGHDSHGIVRIPRYLMWEKSGNLSFGQSASVLIDSDNFALIDGNKGFGQVVGQQAVDIGIKKAKQAGICILALAASRAFGTDRLLGRARMCGGARLDPFCECRAKYAHGTFRLRRSARLDGARHDWYRQSAWR